MNKPEYDIILLELMIGLNLAVSIGLLIIVILEASK